MDYDTEELEPWQRIMVRCSELVLRLERTFFPEHAIDDNGEPWLKGSRSRRRRRRRRRKHPVSSQGPADRSVLVSDLGEVGEGPSQVSCVQGVGDLGSSAHCTPETQRWVLNSPDPPSAPAQPQTSDPRNPSPSVHRNATQLETLNAEGSPKQSPSTDRDTAQLQTQNVQGSPTRSSSTDRDTAQPSPTLSEATQPQTADSRNPSLPRSPT